MRLLVGPTCAGKSTLFKEWHDPADAEGLGLTIHFAHQLGEDTKIPTGPQDVVHFNLLRKWTPRTSVSPRRWPSTRSGPG